MDKDAAQSDSMPNTQKCQKATKVVCYGHKWIGASFYAEDILFQKYFLVKFSKLF